jgi:hypothetical protein
MPSVHPFHIQSPQVGCLEELARLQAAAGDAAQRPDWTHIFCSVLPSLPLPPSSSATGVGLGRHGDMRVATALRTAVARLVANHINAFRQVKLIKQCSPGWCLTVYCVACLFVQCPLFFWRATSAAPISAKTIH